ncbi:MAG: DUF4013 domain-containing protein [Thermodesulfobacteriota bacterium]|nr:DUF4013 domain-containing protein [Thermodesulfobacteriota bacterium]
MTDIEKVIRFPFHDRQWVQKLIVGGVLNIVPFIHFFSVGYAYQVYRSSLKKEEACMPEWKNWDDLFIKGLIVSIICLCYSFLPAFCTVLGVHLVMKGWLASFLGGLLCIMGFGSGLFSLFFLPMAIANYICEGEQIGNAFRFGVIFDKIKEIQSDYLVSYLVGIGIVILAGLLLWVPTGRYLVFAIGMFYVYLFLAVLFGETCATVFEKVENSEETAIHVVMETEESVGNQV